MTMAVAELTEKIDIQPASSEYTALGARYSHSGHSLNYSPILTRTGMDYYDSKNELPDSYRMSTAAEELAIQLALKKAGKDPRKAEVFNDLFGRKNNDWYAWQWTETGLRVPKGYKSDKSEKDEQGRKYFPRIVLIGDHEIGEVLVPEGSGRAVVEWDEVFGIPRVMSDKFGDMKSGDMKLENHTTHFYFDANPEKDDRSGEYDVSVARGGRWPHAGHDRCLNVRAFCGSWLAGTDAGVRQVQGSLSEIKRI